MVHDPNTDASRTAEPRDRLLPVERLVAAVSMALLCLISFANVLVRYVSDYSFAFTEEYSTFLLVLITFVGASIAVARNSHLRVAFFADMANVWGRFCRVAGRVAALVMFGLIAWYGSWLAWDEYRFEELSAGLGVPSWRYTVWMTILSLLIIGRILYAWWKEARSGQ